MTRPLSESIIVSEWWKNRGGDSVRISLSTYQGRNLIDVRTWHSTAGKLLPGKGFAADIRHLPRLAAAFVKAEVKARELGLITDENRSAQ